MLFGDLKKAYYECADIYLEQWKKIIIVVEWINRNEYHGEPKKNV